MKILEIARKQIGTGESPRGSNKTKYGAWYGLDGYPWCAMFVSWCLNKVGIDEWRHAYTPDGVNLFKAAGRWHTSNPKPGDVVFFDFPDSVHRVQHVGLVVCDNGNGTITDIEGNTSASASGSQDNGDGVYEKVRPTSHVVGYGRPDYKVKEPREFAITGVKIVERTVSGKDKADAVVERMRKNGYIVKKERIKDAD